MARRARVDRPPEEKLEIELFITMAIDQGKQFIWQLTYEYYTLPAEAS
jgi:hypothetical protein